APSAAAASNAIQQLLSREGAASGSADHDSPVAVHTKAPSPALLADVLCPRKRRARQPKLTLCGKCCRQSSSAQQCTCVRTALRRRKRGFVGQGLVAWYTSARSRPITSSARRTGGPFLTASAQELA